METLQERQQRHLKSLNNEIGALWAVERKLAMSELPEFIYALDQLDEITRTTHFKSNRILETPDTRSSQREVNRAFNSYRLHDKDFTWKIKSVGPGTADAIMEFLKRDYINVLFRVMKTQENNKVELTLDGQKYYFRLEVRTPHPMFAVLEYTDVSERKVLKLPFFLNRLGKSVLHSGYRVSTLRKVI